MTSIPFGAMSLSWSVLVLVPQTFTSLPQATNEANIAKAEIKDAVIWIERIRVAYEGA